MVPKSLKELFKRVVSWPEEAQQEAAASLLAIKGEVEEAFKLSEEDQQAIDAGLNDLKFDRITAEEDVDELFGRYCLQRPTYQAKA